jgi:hypothetical protein
MHIREGDREMAVSLRREYVVELGADDTDLKPSEISKNLRDLQLSVRELYTRTVAMEDRHPWTGGHKETEELARTTERPFTCACGSKRFSVYTSDGISLSISCKGCNNPERYDL